MSREISSSDRPIVSGRKLNKNRAPAMQTSARNRKKPGHEMACATERKEVAITVAVSRLRKVVALMAFARIHIANTSEGISQPPGPMPQLKKAK
jgi:hypothetical protein